MQAVTAFRSYVKDLKARSKQKIEKLFRSDIEYVFKNLHDTKSIIKRETIHHFDILNDKNEIIFDTQDEDEIDEIMDVGSIYQGEYDVSIDNKLASNNIYPLLSIYFSIPEFESRNKNKVSQSCINLTIESMAKYIEDEFITKYVNKYSPTHVVRKDTEYLFLHSDRHIIWIKIHNIDGFMCEFELNYLPENYNFKVGRGTWHELYNQDLHSYLPALLKLNYSKPKNSPEKPQNLTLLDEEIATKILEQGIQKRSPNKYTSKELKALIRPPTNASAV